MTPEAFATLMTLSLVAAFTPGPNNALVASSGATFGLRRTMPHVMGITIGFPLMIFLVGLFLGEVFQQSALLREGLRWIGAALLLYVAWKIAMAGGIGTGPQNARPFSFVQAAAFQWINPKGWVMAIALSAQFISPARPLTTAGIIAAVTIFAGFTSALAWAGAGRAMARWIGTPARVRLFNMVMGGLIALGVLALIFE